MSPDVVLEAPRDGGAPEGDEPRGVYETHKTFFLSKLFPRYCMCSGRLF